MGGGEGNTNYLLSTVPPNHLLRIINKQWEDSFKSVVPTRDKKLNRWPHYYTCDSDSASPRSQLSFMMLVEAVLCWERQEQSPVAPCLKDIKLLNLPQVPYCVRNAGSLNSLVGKDFKIIESNHNLTSSCAQLLHCVPKLLIQMASTSLQGWWPPPPPWAAHSSSWQAPQ